jgi:molecular chaperone HscB
MSDPFHVFQIEPRFDLDLGALGQRHRDLSRALHPDRYAGRPAAERREALGRAIQVNEAWRVLRDPVRRAEALLRRLGVALGEDSQPPDDPEFLMNMMERRETLRELAKRADVAAITALSEHVRADEQRTLAELGEGLARALERQAALDRPASEPSPAAAGLTVLLGQLRYYRRFFDEVETLLDELAG